MNPVKTAHTLDLVRRARRLRRSSGIRELRARDAAVGRAVSLSAFRGRRAAACGAKCRRCPGSFNCRSTKLSAKRRPPGPTEFLACCSSACPRRKTTSARPPTTRTRPSRAPCARSSAASPDTVVVTDVCLCEYTSHGHCGVLEGPRRRRTTRRSTSSCAQRCRTRPQEPTSSRPPT